jgi:hypothetical protein
VLSCFCACLLAHVPVRVFFPELEAVAALERALKYAPSHPGLCHLYVHVMEMSPTPGAACGACDYLRRDFPGVYMVVW